MKEYLAFIKARIDQECQSYESKMKLGEYDFCPCSNDPVAVSSYPKKVVPFLTSYARCKDSQIPSDAHRVAVIIGGGNILSLIQYLDPVVDDVIFIDISPVAFSFFCALRGLVLQAVQNDQLLDDQSIQYIKRQVALMSKYDAYWKERRMSTKGDKLQSLLKSFELECERMGEYHFLANSSNLRACAKSLSTKEFIYLNIDITDTFEVKVFGDALKRTNTYISYLYATNVLYVYNLHITSKLKVISNFREWEYTEPTAIVSVTDDMRSSVGSVAEVFFHNKIDDFVQMYKEIEYFKLKAFNDPFKEAIALHLLRDEDKAEYARFKEEVPQLT